MVVALRRFLVGKAAISGGIEETPLQVFVHDKDKNPLCFLRCVKKDTASQHFNTG